MRRLRTGIMVALMAAAIPVTALAGNQEVANQIKHVMESSGRLYHYRVGVKFLNGTAWLRGQVANEEQMETAIRLAFEVQAVDRVVNELSVAQKSDAGIAKSHNPLRTSRRTPSAASLPGTAPGSGCPRLPGRGIASAELVCPDSRPAGCRRGMAG